MSAISSQMKDLIMLVETKSHSSPRVLLEGTLNESYIRLAEDIHSDLVKFDKLLVEFQVSQEQVDDIFKRVAQGAKDGYNTDSGEADASSNRTMFGKIADVGKKAYGVWDKLKTAIAQSAVVKAFDAKYHEVVQKLSKTKAGQMVSGVLDIYRNFAKKHPVMQEFILLVVAILANMAMGGAVPGPAITGVLRFADRLLLGDRLSSATWKGVKAAGLQMLLMKAVDLYKNPEQVTNWIKSVFPDDVSQAAASAKAGAASQAGAAGQAAGQAGAAGQAAGQAAAGALPNASGPIQFKVPSGEAGFLSNIADKFNISVAELQAANPNIDPKLLSVANPNNVLAGQVLTIPQATGSAIYAGGVGLDATTKAAQAAGQMGANIGRIKESIDYKRIKERWELQKELNLPQTSSLYLTNEGVARVFRKIEKYAESSVNEGFFDNLTNKITYSHLDNWWKRNYGDNVTKGSVDSKDLIAFLRKMKVKDPLIAKVFGELNLPVDEVTPVNLTVPEPAPVDDKSKNDDQQAPIDNKSKEAPVDDKKQGPVDDKKQGGMGQYNVDYSNLIPKPDQSDSSWSASMEVPAPKPWTGDKTQDATSKTTKYQDVMGGLKQIMSKRDKDRILAWIEKNWGISDNKAKQPTPKPRTGRKTSKQTPKKKTAKPFPTRYDYSGKPDTKTPGTDLNYKRMNIGEGKKITKESRVRPPWLGRP